MIAMVVYFVIYLPNTIILRPHPGLWRMLQALGTCWLCAVVFALFFVKYQPFIGISMNY